MEEALPKLKAINIGIGGDKTQNVLWRLDHGGVDGLQPRLILLMIGNNNMFFTPETGIEPAASGIEMCVKNLRDKFPKVPIIVAKILPAHQPGNRFYEDIKKTNAALDPLKLESNPDVFVLDLWNDFTTEDGTIMKDLYTSDNIHLSAAGYAVYAERLEPMIDAIFAGKPLPPPFNRPKPRDTSSTNTPEPTRSTAKPVVRTTKRHLELPSSHRPCLITLTIHITRENSIHRLLVGLSATLSWHGYKSLNSLASLGTISSSICQSSGLSRQPHLTGKPRTGAMRMTGSNIMHNASNKFRRCEITSISHSSVTASRKVGGAVGWDGAPFNAAWQKHFGTLKTVNLGIGGDRMEHILWRLDHGAIEGVSPKCIVLMIGVNNANGVHANGVPVDAAAQGIKLCVKNLRLRCPQSLLC